MRLCCRSGVFSWGLCSWAWDCDASLIVSEWSTRVFIQKKTQRRNANAIIPGLDSCRPPLLEIGSGVCRRRELFAVRERRVRFWDEQCVCECELRRGRCSCPWRWFRHLHVCAFVHDGKGVSSLFVTRRAYGLRRRLWLCMQSSGVRAYWDDPLYSPMAVRFLEKTRGMFLVHENLGGGSGAGVGADMECMECMGYSTLARRAWSGACCSSPSGM